ncbi:flagellar protein FlaG [Anaerocolumna sp. AGMB13025]|uniref:flagellar protein FlaG n=1 Tax=Anaerocolumna sp. AGMB13025 TaxID=3039116 RepID=UPI00241D7DDE|nr:flagellar protein FlaG [Anaerocolumna sp. AGMB13025]WFR56805.1 flagellar protein FlaG [Anaerocolumna sp. AGMB13025]
MAIESIANAVPYGEYKPEQRVQPVTIQPAVTLPGSDADTTSGKTLTGKQDGTKEEEKQKDAQANANRLKSILNETNNKIKPTRTRCEFSYHEDINRVSIKVMDVDSDKVIREIPPEETLEMLQKLWEVAGLLVDEKR